MNRPQGWLLTSTLLLCASSAFAGDRPALVAPEDFAILPWNLVPGDAKMLESIRECGFNLAGFVAPEDLDAVKAAGLKAIVWHLPLQVNDPTVDEAQIRKNARTIVERVGKHPAVYGYYLRDEPPANLFAPLGKSVAAIRELAPAARCYVNMFPIHALPEQLGTSQYADYVEQFITTIKPSFVSYDHYALFGNGVVHAPYFPNLEVVRKAALAHKLPFWNIVLANAHFNYAEPTEAGLRFQAYTTLAYGGRGISYFTYMTPITGNYRLAPIDQFGNKTPTWDMLRRVNLQIHALAPTLVKLTSVNVFHHPDVPAGCQGIASSKHVAEVSGDSLVVGEFEDANGQPYAMVVNKSLQAPMACGLKFKKPGPVVHISSYTGQAGPWVGEDVWLAPGQGALLTIQPK